MVDGRLDGVGVGSRAVDGARASSSPRLLGRWEPDPLTAELDQARVVCALGPLAGMLFMSTPSVADVHRVNVVGERSGGHYFVNGNVIRPFAGTFVGDFTSEDCVSAAAQIHTKFEDAGERIELNSTSIIELSHDQRMLVLGVEDETANRWVHVCVDIASTRTDTWRYDLGNGPYASNGWETRSVPVNGKRWTIKFADNDHGAVVFSILG